jgi:Flp pilus assembly protein TadG
MRSRIRRQRGQALLMISISAVLIFGMLGLAVDLGWGYFVKKSARAAADAAAMAAARKAFASLGSKGPYTCGAGLDCQAIAVNCSTLAPSSNLYNGCQYALKNLTTGLSTAQNLLMASGTGSPFNTST